MRESRDYVLSSYQIVILWVTTPSSLVVVYVFKTKGIFVTNHSNILCHKAKKSTVVSFQATEIYKGRRSIAPLILSLEIRGNIYASAALPQEKPPTPV